MMSSPFTSGACRRTPCQCPTMPCVFPLWTGILLGLLMLTLGQKLPTRDEDHFHFQISHAEIFFDTKLLPDGAEVATYLHKGIERRFFFMVEDDSTPVSLVVTPCASAVEWKLSLHDLPEEKSGDGAEEYDDPLMQQEAAVKPTRETATLLQTYTGDNVASFLTTDSMAGLYVLELKTTDSDGSVRLYATTTPHSDHAYPEKPSDPKVRVESVSKHTIEVSWKPSPTQSVHGQDVDYCLAVNTMKNFKTQCAAVATIDGDIPPTAPPNAGFGFAWELERKEETGTTEIPVEEENDSEEWDYICVGHKTSYSINNLRPGKKYFVDVFVVHSNRSTAYEGISVQTKQSVKRIPLKEGKVLTTFIKRNMGDKLFKYRLKRQSEELYVVVNPCFGELQVEISHDGNVLERRTIQNFEKILLRNASSGNYLIEISTKRRQSAYFKVVVARRESRIPYPILPEDISIKEFGNQRTCKSLTVAWLGTDKKYQYCLYAKELKSSDNPLNSLLSRWNKCIDLSSRKKSEKILCTNVRFKKKNRAVITKQIRGLKKNTKYVIDVYISKIGGHRETLSYQSTWVSTKDKC